MQMTLYEFNNLIEQMGNITKLMAGEKISTVSDEELVEGAKKLGLKTPKIDRDSLPEWAKKCKFPKGAIKGE